MALAHPSERNAKSAYGQPKLAAQALKKTRLNCGFLYSVQLAAARDMIESFPGADETRDVLLSSWIGAAPADSKTCLAEMRGIMPVGARMVLQVPSMSYREATPDLLARFDQVSGAANCYRLLELSSQLRECGFSVIDWCYVLNSALSHRLFAWALSSKISDTRYAILSPLAHMLCLLSDRIWGLPNEGHFLVIQAEAR